MIFRVSLKRFVRSASSERFNPDKLRLPLFGTLTMPEFAVLTHRLWWWQQAEIILCLKSADLEKVIGLIAARVSKRLPWHMEAILDDLPPSFHPWRIRVLQYLNWGVWNLENLHNLILEGLRIGIYSDRDQAFTQLIHYLGLLRFSPESPSLWDAILQAIGPGALQSALESDLARARLGNAVIPLLEELRDL
jgi:hypothetical protein